MSDQIAGQQEYFEYKGRHSPFYGVGRGTTIAVTKENLDELKTKGVNFISNFITSPGNDGEAAFGRYDQDICATTGQSVI